jgi:hypothetical protein
MPLFPILSFILLVTDFRLFSDFQFLKTITGVEKPNARNNDFEKDIRDQNTVSGLKKWYFRYTSFLDSRARSIDSLLLLLLVDFTFDYDLSILLLIISGFIILRAIVMYIASVYFTFKTYSENANG